MRLSTDNIGTSLMEILKCYLQVDDGVCPTSLHGVELQVSLEVASVEPGDGQPVAEPCLQPQTRTLSVLRKILVVYFSALVFVQIVPLFLPAGLCVCPRMMVWELWSTGSWRGALSSSRGRRRLCRSSGKEGSTRGRRSVDDEQNKPDG